MMDYIIITRDGMRLPVPAGAAPASLDRVRELAAARSEAVQAGDQERAAEISRELEEAREETDREQLEAAETPEDRQRIEARIERETVRREQDRFPDVRPTPAPTPTPDPAPSPAAEVDAAPDVVDAPRLTPEEFARQTGVSVEEARRRLEGFPGAPGERRDVPIVDREGTEVDLPTDPTDRAAFIAGLDPESVRDFRETEAERREAAVQAAAQQTEPVQVETRVLSPDPDRVAIPGDLTIERAEFERLDPEEQAALTTGGIPAFDALQQRRAAEFEERHVQVGDPASGKWVPREEFDRLPPELQQQLRQQGVEQFQRTLAIGRAEVGRELQAQGFYIGPEFIPRDELDARVLGGPREIHLERLRAEESRLTAAVAQRERALQTLRQAPPGSIARTQLAGLENLQQQDQTRLEQLRTFMREGGLPPDFVLSTRTRVDRHFGQLTPRDATRTVTILALTGALTPAVLAGLQRVPRAARFVRQALADIRLPVPAPGMGLGGVGLTIVRRPAPRIAPRPVALPAPGATARAAAVRDLQAQAAREGLTPAVRAEVTRLGLRPEAILTTPTATLAGAPAAPPDVDPTPVTPEPEITPEIAPEPAPSTLPVPPGREPFPDEPIVPPPGEDPRDPVFDPAIEPEIAPPPAIPAPDIPSPRPEPDVVPFVTPPEVEPEPAPVIAPEPDVITPATEPTPAPITDPFTEPAPAPVVEPAPAPSEPLTQPERRTLTQLTTQAQTRTLTSQEQATLTQLATRAAAATGVPNAPTTARTLAEAAATRPLTRSETTTFTRLTTAPAPAAAPLATPTVPPTMPPPTMPSPRPPGVPGVPPPRRPGPSVRPARPPRPDQFPRIVAWQHGALVRMVDKQTGAEIFTRKPPPGMRVHRGKGAADRSFRVLSRSPNPPRFRRWPAGKVTALTNGRVRFKRRRRGGGRGRRGRIV